MSPLRDAPLRNPGEGLEEAVADRRNESFYYIGAAFGGAALLIIMEWEQYLFSRPPRPYFMTFMGLAWAAICFWFVRRRRREQRRFENGLLGEKAVGQDLEKLRARGFHVLHSIPLEAGDIDHALVGPCGLFIFESKYRSQPPDRDAVVHFDGQTIRVDGFEPDRDPVSQARRCAASLREIVRARCGIDQHVQAVVMFPGWRVVGKGSSGNDVWVLNPGSLRRFLDREPHKLDPRQIGAITAAIESHVRDECRKLSARV